MRRREAHRAPQRQSWVTQTPNNHDAQYAWTRACELTRLTPRIRVHHLGHGYRGLPQRFHLALAEPLSERNGKRLRRPFVKAQILGAHRGCDGLCTIESHRALFSIKDERTHAKFSETFNSSAWASGVRPPVGKASSTGFASSTLRVGGSASSACPPRNAIIPTVSRQR